MEAQQKHTSSGAWLLALLIGCAILIVRIISLRDVFGPVVYGDEFIYWRNMMALFGSEGALNTGYPPLYSSFMGLGMFWPDTYRGVLLINALVGSILPFVAWRISRPLGSAYRITAVLLISVLPLLFVYPRMIDERKSVCSIACPDAVGASFRCQEPVHLGVSHGGNFSLDRLYDQVPGTVLCCQRGTGGYLYLPHAVVAGEKPWLDCVSGPSAVGSRYPDCGGFHWRESCSGNGLVFRHHGKWGRQPPTSTGTTSS